MESGVAVRKCSLKHVIIKYIERKGETIYVQQNGYGDCIFQGGKTTEIIICPSNKRKA